MWITIDKQSLPQISKVQIFKSQVSKVFFQVNHNWAKYNFPKIIIALLELKNLTTQT